MPSARSIAIGSIAPWADHEKTVCSRLSRTISSLVIRPVTVPMPMVHLVPAVRRPTLNVWMGGQYHTGPGGRAAPSRVSAGAAAQLPEVVDDEQQSEQDEPEQ